MSFYRGVALWAVGVLLCGLLVGFFFSYLIPRKHGPPIPTGQRVLTLLIVLAGGAGLEAGINSARRKLGKKPLPLWGRCLTFSVVPALWVAGTLLGKEDRYWEPLGEPEFGGMADEVWREFKDNNKTANAKYDGKVIRIGGRVQMTQGNLLHFFSPPEVRFAWWTVECQFDQIVPVSPGDFVTIEGRCKKRSVGTHLILTKCRFVDNPAPRPEVPWWAANPGMNK